MKMPGATVRVLMIEDNPDDVELELASLRQAGFTVVPRVVETVEAVQAALEQATWDVIICDYCMPEINGLDALRIAKELAPDTAFLLVSGTIGEHVAVDAMRAGAHDYILKDNLTRLASAVQRELREAELRKSGVVSQKALRLLADVGAALGASFDYQANLDQVARIVAGAGFGPLCIIDLVYEDGTLHRAAAHTDAAKEDLLTQLELEHPLQARGGPADLAISRRKSVVIDDVERESATASEIALLQIAKSLGLKTLLCVPLVVENRALGVIHVAGHRLYSPLEVHVVEELSGRVAVAIENARLYEHALRAVTLRDEFLSVASHELKTPLAALQLQVQGLQEIARKRPEWSSDNFASRVDRCARSVERLRKLVDSVLDVSRSSMVRLRLNVENLDLVSVVQEAAEPFREEARRAGCDLYTFANAPISGSWDRLRLDQVLSNLLSNAIKYGAGKPIEIELTADDDRTVLNIVDHGIGIPDEDLERVFGRFERAVSTRHYGGLGLGLFITRRIVDAHGGTVVARPTPGGGATLTVTLPRAVDATNRASVPPPFGASPLSEMPSTEDAGAVDGS